MLTSVAIGSFKYAVLCWFDYLRFTIDTIHRKQYNYAMNNSDCDRKISFPCFTETLNVRRTVHVTFETFVSRLTYLSTRLLFFQFTYLSRGNNYRFVAWHVR